MAVMDAKPKRRWFRFRLSTVLILTAILAWAMSCWPWLIPVYTFYIRPKIGHGETTWVVNRPLLWPALALAAFLAWKAAWAVVEHRRHQSASPE